MAHEILVDPDAGMIEVRYIGTIALPERRAVIAKVCALVQQTGLMRLLVNFERAEAGDDGFERSNRFASLLASEPTLRVCRTAWLADESRRVNPVVEILADARRFPFRRFSTRAEALGWLGQSA